VGDRIPLTGTIFPGIWELTVRGVYQGRDRLTDTTAMFFRWDLLNEWVKANYRSQDQAGWYVLKIADPAEASRVSREVDAQFADASAATLTETEQAFQMGFVSMAGTIVAAIEAISFTVVVIILLVMANTMMMCARERISQYGVMKTVGFRARHLALVIAGEAMVLALAGAALGTAGAYPLVRALGAFLEANLGSFFPVFELSPATVLQAAGLCVLCGLLAAALPLRSAVATSIAAALRKVN
jgi:putative ABC transport system permease protein